jgi:transcriptional regulator with XRE-family HTH domain
MSNEKLFSRLTFIVSSPSPKAAAMAMRYVSPTLLKKLRQEKNLTQSQLGQQIGVTKAAVSAYELGKSTPSEAVLSKLAQLFDSSIANLSQLLRTPAPPAPPAPVPQSGACRAVPLLGAAQQALFGLSFAAGLDQSPLGASMEVPGVPLTPDFANPLVVELPDEAMSPTLRAGTRLLATPVARDEWPYMPSGLYCLVYRSTFIVRRVKDDSSAGGMHPVRAEDLRAVWRVRWVVYAPVN